jgi:S1-C subfamily serine protease
VIVSPEGLVVTAHHVLEWDEGVEVTLADGRTVAATLVGRDPGTDLALLRVGAGGLAAAAWSTAPVKVGHLALAVSRSGQGARAAFGIVTLVGGAWRTASGGHVDRYLETDVGLHAGFSGSLLVDAAGAALGVNTAGLFRGAAVTIPAPTVERVMQALATHGQVRRGYLGIGTMPVPLGPEREQALAQEAGLLVTSVQAGAPAHRAGLLLGDVLVSFDGHPLVRPRDLMACLDEEAVGRTVTLKLLRAGQPTELAVTVGSRDRSAS